MKSNKYDTQKIPIVKPENYTKEETNKHNTSTDKLPEAKAKHIKTKKKNKFKKAFTSFLLILTIIFLTVSVGLYAIFSRLSYEPSDNRININMHNITCGIYNILLIGTDKEDNGHSRSDSMILISIDNNSDSIKMISFLRDMWVDIPDNGSGRLNSAFSIGGPQLLIDTLESNFDIQIDNYVLIDFEMFKKLIDELGGITVEISEKEAKFINRTTKATVNPGENNLNGYEALVYCRIRKLDSDFMRTQRQRKVISAIIDKIKNQSIITTASTGINILPLITTDISPAKMTIKTPVLISSINNDVVQLRIPADNTYENKTINSQAVLVADFDKNKELINEFIYN